MLLIVGTRPLFGYLMISFGFVWFSYGFLMFLVDFHRPLSPDLRSSNGFLWLRKVLLHFGLSLIVGHRPISGYLIISYGFVLSLYGFVLFWVDFSRRPSPDFRLSYGFQ